MGSLPTQTIPWLFDSLIKSCGAFPTAGSMEGTRSEIGRRPHLGISQAAGAAGCCEVLICVWGVLMGLGDQLLVSAEKGQGKGSSSSSLLGEGCSAHLLPRKTTRGGGITHTQCQMAYDDSRGKKKSHLFISQIYLPVP